MRQLFTWGGQSIGVSASTSVFPMNTQDWSPLGWTGWISLQSKRRSRVFSNLLWGFLGFLPALLRCSVAQSCLTLWDPIDGSTPGLPGHHHHHLPEFTQTHIHQVGDAIQPSHPPSSPFPLTPNPSQYQSLFQWGNSSHEVAKVLVSVFVKC